MQSNTSIATVKYFILANNSLSGDIPSWLAEPYYNTYIDLSGNDFSNACDEDFAGLNACPGENQTTQDPQGTAPSVEDQTDKNQNSTTTSDSGGGGGISPGATAAIVLIVIVLLAGMIGGYMYWRRKRQTEGKFERFDDEKTVEMGRSNQTMYNPSLEP